MNFRLKAAAVVLSLLLCLGIGLRSLEVAAGSELVAPAMASPDGGLCAGAGCGASAAVLGGFRALAADVLWLQTYLAWAARDVRQTQTLIHLVTLVDDRPLGFWLNGARMLAYDMTQWRLNELDGAGPTVAIASKRIREEQAGLALRYLGQARRRHPGSAEICVEIANIHLNIRRDLAAAAFWYRRAAESPSAPYYAARIHAELLKRLGRPNDAYVWLRDLHPKLPRNEEAAMSDVILKRIRDLEEILAIPVAERYSTGAASGRPKDS